MKPEECNYYGGRKPITDHDKVYFDCTKWIGRNFAFETEIDPVFDWERKSVTIFLPKTQLNRRFISFNSQSYVSFDGYAIQWKWVA
jgi:hypothetical protein